MSSAASAAAGALFAAAIYLIHRKVRGEIYEINIPEVQAELVAVHKRYEKALAENDVTVLDELFFDAPSTVRYGPDASQHGYAAIASMRASKKHPPGPRSEYVSKNVTTYGRDFGTASIECRRANEPRLLRQMQTWLRTPRGWRVVAAHVSFAA